MTEAALHQARALRVDVSPVERAIAALNGALADVEVLADESATYAGVRARLLAGGAEKLLAFHATLAPADFRGRIWRGHAKSLAALLARPGTPYVRLETRAGLPGLVTVGVDLEGPCTLGDANAFLEVADVNQVSRERLTSLVSGFGTRCACLADRLAPPGLLTRTVWMQPEGELVGAADRVAQTLGVLSGHRTLLARHLALALPRWIGLRVARDEVLPEIHVLFDADPALAARLLADTGRDQARALIRGRAAIEMRYHAEGQPLALVRASTVASPAPAPAKAVPTREDLSFGVVASRVGTAASLNAIDASALLAALQPFGKALSRHTRVTMRAEADRLGVMFPVPKDPAGKAGLDELLRIHGATAEPPAGAHVELVTMPRKPDLELWLHDEGTPNRDRLGGLVANDTKLLELAQRIDPRGPVARSVRVGTKDALVHFEVSGDRAVPVIVTTAEALSLAPAQRQLIAKLHAHLARDADAIVSLRVGEHGLIPEIRVGYRNLTWDVAVRIIVPLRPGHDAGGQLGNLAGALRSSRVAQLTLVLRPEDPMRALVATDLVPGTDLA